MSLSVDPIFRSTQAPYSPSDPTCSSGKPETTFNGGVGSACTPLIIRGGRRKSVRRSVRKSKKSIKSKSLKSQMRPTRKTKRVRKGKTRARKMRGGGYITFKELQLRTILTDKELQDIIAELTEKPTVTPYKKLVDQYSKELADAILITFIKKFPKYVFVNTEENTITIDYYDIEDYEKKNGSITIDDLEKEKSLTESDINQIIDSTKEVSSMLLGYETTLRNAIIRTLIINFPKYVSFIRSKLIIDFTGILDNFKSGRKILKNNLILIEGYIPPSGYEAYYISDADKRLTLSKTLSSSRTNLKNVPLTSSFRSKINRSNESRELPSFEMAPL